MYKPWRLLMTMSVFVIGVMLFPTAVMPTQAFSWQQLQGAYMTPTPVGGEAGINLTIQQFLIDPSNAQPGQDVTISIVVANTGDEAVNDTFYVDLYINPPQSVTTGGQDWSQVGSTLDPVQGIEWVVDGLGAGEEVRLTSTDGSYDANYSNWNGQLPDGANKLYVFADSWAENGSTNGLVRESNEQDNGRDLTIQTSGPTATPASPTPTTQPTAQPTPSGNPNFEDSINFRPNPNGFKFENWGGNKYSDADDLNTGQLVRMFGASNVCRTGNTAQDCVLNAAARKWRQAELKGVRGGHCYGMAVSSQRFFNGTANPSTFQSGASNAFALDPLTQLRASITEWAVSQSLSPADGSSNQWRWNLTPQETLDLIRAQFKNNPNNPYVLGFFQKGKGGHAVTPYGIENKGDGIYWLHIYDNNWPDEDRYIIFDTNKNTWLYAFSALNPSEPAGAWSGSARTKSLALRPTSAHIDTGWACPFCQGTTNRQGGQSLEFTLTGEDGALYILDPQERAIGYNFETEQEINELGDEAEISPNIGGQGEELVPTYRLPLIDNGTPYLVYVAGRYMTDTVDTDLQVAGPGFTVGMDFIQINEGEDLLMTISANGQQITFNASEEGTWGPDIYFALDPDPNEDSYVFEIDGFVLEAFKTVTATLDLEKGELYFEDNDGNADTYDLSVTRIDKDGNESSFENDGVELGGEEDAVMNFGAWDGSGGMTFTIGGTQQVFQNEVKRVFLPIVVK